MSHLPPLRTQYVKARCVALALVNLWVELVVPHTLPPVGAVQPIQSAEVDKYMYSCMVAVAAVSKLTCTAVHVYEYNNIIIIISLGGSRSDFVSSQKSINRHAGNDSSIVDRTSRTRLTWSFATDIKPNSNGPPRNGQDPGLTMD